jgi:hypothetical protein
MLTKWSFFPGQCVVSPSLPCTASAITRRKMRNRTSPLNFIKLELSSDGKKLKKQTLVMKSTMHKRPSFGEKEEVIRKVRLEFRDQNT